MSRTVKVKGHEGVAALVGFAEGKPWIVDIMLEDRRALELSAILDRALNCWPEGPQWAFELSDALKATPPDDEPDKGPRA